MKNDEYYMQLAINEALNAYDEGEIPVGAVIVAGNKVISRGYNMVEKLNDATAHAEIIALTSAFNYLGSKYLPDASLYVTVEPCIMCAGALYWSKIGQVIWGASDDKNGFKHITQNNSPFHPKTFIRSGILKEECARLMQEFFRERRK